MSLIISAIASGTEISLNAQKQITDDLDLKKISKMWIPTY